jgi:uncharacterized protein YwqG
VGEWRAQCFRKMIEPKTNCCACGAEILVATANRTGGYCMPCARKIPDDPFDITTMRPVAKDLIAQHPELAPVADRILAELSIGMQLVEDPSDGTAVGQTRLGGIPDVASGFAWPRYSGKPLSLIAQINCGEANRFDPDGLLPRSGILHFFYLAEEEHWGSDLNDKGSAVVLFTESDELAPAEVPADLEQSSILPCHGVAFRPFASLPVPESASYESLGLSADQEEAYGFVSSGLPGDWVPRQPAHILLGHAHEMSGMQLQCQRVNDGLYCGDESGDNDPEDEELSASATDWRLLLQIDSDGEPGESRGDGRKIFFWIRRTDLQQQRFENTWTIREYFG